MEKYITHQRTEEKTKYHNSISTTLEKSNHSYNIIANSKQSYPKNHIFIEHDITELNYIPSIFKDSLENSVNDQPVYIPYSVEV